MAEDKNNPWGWQPASPSRWVLNAPAFIAELKRIYDGRWQVTCRALNIPPEFPLTFEAKTEVDAKRFVLAKLARKINDLKESLTLLEGE